MVTLTQLRYFQTIVDRGGLTNAAQALGVTQPTLTRSLQSLEFQLDTILLDRRAGVFECTPVGEKLLKRARVLLAEHQSLIQDINRMVTHQAPSTFVNGSPLSIVSLLPRIVSHMATHQPAFPVSVKGDNGANYEWKTKALLSGELDVILTLYDPMLNSEDLQQELLVEPEMRIMVNASHPLADGREIDFDELATYRWIMPPAGSSPRAAVENECIRRGVSVPTDTIEISDWRIALRLMKTAPFVIVIPYHPVYFSDELDDLITLPISFRTKSLAMSLVTRAMPQQREATEAFIRTARHIVAEYGSPRCLNPEVAPDAPLKCSVAD